MSKSPREASGGRSHHGNAKDWAAENNFKEVVQVSECNLTWSCGVLRRGEERVNDGQVKTKSKFGEGESAGKRGPTPRGPHPLVNTKRSAAVTPHTVGTKGGVGRPLGGTL